MRNIEHECCLKLIEKFCISPKSFGNEIKIAKKLLYECPDIEAWESLVLPRPINSLSFFLTSDGDNYIPLSKKNPYLLDLDKLRPKTKDKEYTEIILPQDDLQLGLCSEQEEERIYKMFGKEKNKVDFTNPS